MIRTARTAGWESERLQATVRKPGAGPHCYPKSHIQNVARYHILTAFDLDKIKRKLFGPRCPADGPVVHVG
jgi:hypothetical protein